jgi:hypothetical protein
VGNSETAGRHDVSFVGSGRAGARPCTQFNFGTGELYPALVLKATRLSLVKRQFLLKV